MVKFCIGIDFSKKTFDATVMEHGKLDGKGIHKVFKNSSQSVQELIQWVKGQTGVPDLGAFVFCGEHTGLYSEAVSDGLAEAGCFMWLENALCIKRARGIARGKSDKGDSREIACYASRNLDKARRHVAPGECLDAIRKLFMQRRFLVEQRCALRKRSKEMRGVSKGNKALAVSFRADNRLDAAYQSEISSIEKEIKRLISSSEELSGTYRILTSMKGISFVNAVALIVYTLNFEKFGHDARRIATYWGVAPFGRDSGTTLHATPHVSHYADKYLKSLLSEAALCAMRFCPTIKRYADRLLAKGKHPNIVRNNVKNKMLHILVAMVRNGECFREAA